MGSSSGTRLRPAVARIFDDPAPLDPRAMATYDPKARGAHPDRIMTATTMEEDWERLLAAERHLQALLPDAVLVGGTAAALHVGHRRSLDGDHVLEQLRDRFDDVLAALEAAAGWQTARVQRPVLILGNLDGIPTGIRQLRRTAPLQTEVVQGLVVPTLEEMARVKAWLLATRHTVRDYLDCVVLLERLGEAQAPRALATLDSLYQQPTGTSVLAEVVDRLARAAPADTGRVELASFRGLVPPWNDWAAITARGRAWSQRLAASLLAGDEEAP